MSPNIISSHVIYKIKINDDHSLKLKARISLHGNEDTQKELCKTDCSMCSPIGITVVLTTAVVRKWVFEKANVGLAFLCTGPSGRHVLAKLPKESKDTLHYWLLVAAYGLLNI